ncbi:MAG: hypothetical protein M3T55_12150, partial [Pseudomonadota bacterium]|nr:hypothetical protein [Pseudomonadota bacterium]
MARGLNRIMVAIRADDAEEVYAATAEIVERAPEAVAPLGMAAEFAARAEDWPMAVRYRAAQMAAQPQDRPAKVALIRALIRAGATAAALDLVDRLLEQAPIGGGFRRLRLEILLADGSSEAVAALCQALMETPANGTAAFMVDVAQILAQGQQFEAARDFVDAGQARHLGNPALARLAATLAYREGRWSEAEELWRELAESDDESARRAAGLYRARIAIAADRGADAAALYGA